MGGGGGVGHTFRCPSGEQILDLYAKKNLVKRVLALIASNNIYSKRVQFC